MAPCRNPDAPLDSLVSTRHAEVLAALLPLGNPRLGAAVQADRGSALPHLGIAMPALRARVARGFSFSALPVAEQIACWNALWHHTGSADVMFAALIALEPVARKQAAVHVGALWPRLGGWRGRIDNWCHSDMLAGLISRVAAVMPDAVLPELMRWNESAELWPRRLALTSVIQGSGKKSVYLPTAAMLSFLEPCVDDHRHYIELAVGWVLRELDRAEPKVVEAFLHRHAELLGSAAFRRAIEKRAPRDRARLLALRH